MNIRGLNCNAGFYDSVTTDGDSFHFGAMRNYCDVTPLLIKETPRGMCPYKNQQHYGEMDHVEVIESTLALD